MYICARHVLNCIVDNNRKHPSFSYIFPYIQRASVGWWQIKWAEMGKPTAIFISVKCWQFPINGVSPAYFSIYVDGRGDRGWRVVGFVLEHVFISARTNGVVACQGNATSRAGKRYRNTMSVADICLPCLARARARVCGCGKGRTRKTTVY